ncbi:hypothetical protein EVAR_4362_1 [Eumeta japonica]|uniref:Uncharacterized protein n=1 Tax=Eumeta variegata TaxID=151549 RepID=A0A4C1T0D8_EUMVA|nr:hypothetical protein EVAR_4362_1 [Eumeta japonica]
MELHRQPQACSKTTMRLQFSDVVNVKTCRRYGVVRIYERRRVTMPRLMSGRDGISEKRQLEWEAAVEAVIRDITTTAPPQRKPPIVQIVIYESSV